MKYFAIIITLWYMFLSPLHADESSPHQQIVDVARTQLGKNYQLNGRNTKEHPGFDYMGLVFQSISIAYNRKWELFYTNPAMFMFQIGKGKRRHFYTDTLHKDTAMDKLQPGDILFFLMDRKNKQAPITKYGGRNLYIWHMGIYTEEGKFIHASPYNLNLKVVEEDLFDMIENNSFKGFIAVKVSIKKKDVAVY